VHLLDRLILLSTDEGDIILDPFSGTGTTAISAKRLGRKYIGFELDEGYVEISRKKLDAVEPNFKLGESWVSFYLNNVITIRNNDWNNLKKYFVIPEPMKTIDYNKTRLIDKKLIPKEKEVIYETIDICKVKMPKTNGKNIKKVETNHITNTVI
jgi:site-specific DNA-methyltransferase (adenine-specific)